VDYFPDSPLAADALFRSADIRWQLDKADIATLPSAHEQEAYLRPQLYEGELKRVMKMYPGTDFEARAAFEADIYLKYAGRYKGGPKSAEALYDAAYRQGALVTMYMVDEQKKRSDGAAKNCQMIADELSRDYPKSDYAARAQAIAFKVRQGIPVYGNDRD